MKRFILGAVLGLGLIGAACSQDGASVTGPSVGAALSSGRQLAQSTIAVLDGTMWGNGDYVVTKYPNYPAEPPSPTYHQRVTNGSSDPCTVRWPGYETNYLIDHDDDGGAWTPAWHWCQPND